MNNRIDNQTRLFLVIGNPVAHSLSPLMHNAAFAHTGYNGVYLAAKVIDVESAIRGIRGIGVAGASVTVPHKVAVIDFLDEIDPTAEKIGAVNTIVNREGRLVGYNTDCAGAVDALKEKTEIAGKRIAVIGAGGAARAVAFGLIEKGAAVTIVNRSKKKGEQLAKAIGGDFIPLSDQPRITCDILINTTPVGMHPKTDQMPVEASILKPGMTVMEVIYTPLETHLLKAARSIGLKTIDGLAMFVRQGALQFELWTDAPAPLNVMKAAVCRWR